MLHAPTHSLPHNIHTLAIQVKWHRILKNNRLIASFPRCKLCAMWYIHFYNKVNLRRQKKKKKKEGKKRKSDFSWTHQRNDVSRQIITLKTGERDSFRESQLRSAYLVETTTGPINWQEHINASCHKSLNYNRAISHCSLKNEKVLRACSFSGSSYICGPDLQ